MSEIFKCPMCSQYPVKMVFGAGWAQDGYKCCGHTTETLDLWNKYCAAMELAQSTVEFTAKVNPVLMRHREAHDRVMEVFGK